MRFHTSHLLVFVIAAALVLAIIRHPETLWAGAVALIGGLCVVLPVLGTIELLAGRDSPATPEVGWLGVCMVCLIAVVGAFLAAACLFALIDLAG